MTLGTHTRRWETVTIYLLVGLIVASLVYAMVLFLRKSAHRPAIPIADEEMVNTAAVVRASNYYRQYRRSLAVHELGAEWKRENTETRAADDYAAAIDEIPESKNPASEIAVPVAPVAMTNPRRGKDEESGDDEPKTGWGWLADDLKKNKSEKENQKQKSDKSEEEEEQSGFAGDQEKKDRELFPQVTFMDGTYDRKEQDRDKDSQNQIRRDDMFPSDRENMDQSDQRPGDEYADQASTAEAADFAARNPFAVPEQTRNEYGYGSPFGSPGQDAFGRDADAASQSLPEDAALRTGSGSSGGSLYGSDSLFSGGAGYESPGFGGARSESIFSSDSMFDGNDRFQSGAGAASPLSGSIGSPSATPENKTGFSDDPGFKAPRVLPW